MSLTEEELFIKRKKREITEEKIRNMSDSSAYCPTCDKKGFESIKRMIYHHNQSHMFEVRRTKICEYCDTAFVPKNSENPNKYCDRICFGLAEKEKTEYVTIECHSKDCNNTQKVYKSAYNNLGRKYCSQDCANSGEDHPNWQGGGDNIRDTPEYYQWKKAIHESYDECQECGKDENLHAHHIVPISENKDLATDINNGTLLCPDCHYKKHKDMNKRLFVNGQ